MKDPYNISVLHTAPGNESEEKIIGVQQESSYSERGPSQKSDVSSRVSGGIHVKKEVDVSTVSGKQDFPQSWKAI